MHYAVMEKEALAFLLWIFWYLISQAFQIRCSFHRNYIKHLQ